MRNERNAWTWDDPPYRSHNCDPEWAPEPTFLGWGGRAPVHSSPVTDRWGRPTSVLWASALLQAACGRVEML